MFCISVLEAVSDGINFKQVQFDVLAGPSRKEGRKGKEISKMLGDLLSPISQGKDNNPSNKVTTKIVQEALAIRRLAKQLSMAWRVQV